MKEYNDISFVDIEWRIISILSDGVHIQRRNKSEIIIPFDGIENVSYEKASFSNLNVGSIRFSYTKKYLDSLRAELKSQTAISVNEFLVKIVKHISFKKKYNDISKKMFDVILEEIKREKGNIITIDNMKGYEFEYYCATLLEKNGFVNVEVTQGSGDQGVDILAQKDDVKYAIQCKRHSNPLGNTPVQEVNAGKIYYKCHVGIVMTNSIFTSGAIKLAEATGVLLWDGSKIRDMEK